MNIQLPPLYYKWQLMQLPSGVWRADGRSNVTRQRFSLGTRDREEAIKNLIQLDAEVAVSNGLIPAEMLGDRRPMVTIDEACERYVGWVQSRVVPEGMHEGTPRIYERLLRTFRRFCSKANVVSVTGITPTLFNRFLTSLATSYQPSYIASHADQVKMLVTYLIQERIRPPHAAIKVKVSRPRVSTRYCFTVPEVQAILKHCRDISSLSWLHPLLSILAYTGMRISEALALRWSDLNFERNEIDLTDDRFDEARRKTGDVRRLKGRKSRLIPLHVELAAILQAHPRHRDGHVVHTAQGKRPSYHDVFVAFKDDVLEPLAPAFPTPLGAAVGFVDGRFHSFRHFFCSVAHDLGLSEHQVMAILGHSESAMVRRYYHPRMETAHTVLAKLSLDR